MVKEFIKVSDETGFKSILSEIGDEITKFLNYPVIRDGWKFLNTRLEDIPVIGLWFKTVGKAEGWAYEHLVPSDIRNALKTCSDDGLRHPADNPLGFILALGIDTITHPTILDILLEIPGIGEFAETIKATEEALKASGEASRFALEAAKSTELTQAATKGARAAERAHKAADKAVRLAEVAQGTEYEAKAAESARTAEKASDKADEAGKRFCEAL